jgi:hypothetical protein
MARNPAGNDLGNQIGGGFSLFVTCCKSINSPEPVEISLDRGAVQNETSKRLRVISYRSRSRELLGSISAILSRGNFQESRQ